MKIIEEIIVKIKQICRLLILLSSILIIKIAAAGGESAIYKVHNKTSQTLYVIFSDSTAVIHTIQPNSFYERQIGLFFGLTFSFTDVYKPGQYTICWMADTSIHQCLYKPNNINVSISGHEISIARK